MTDEQRVVEICGCSLEAAREALIAAGPGGLELAVDLVIGGTFGPDADVSAAEVERGPSKLVCLVRRDLNMGAGKVAAQVAHAALAAYRQCEARDPVALRDWLDGSGEATVVLAVADEAELLSLMQRARSAGLRTSLVADAGRTEVAPGTTTVGAIGPHAVSDVDAVTGRLALL